MQELTPPIEAVRVAILGKRPVKSDHLECVFKSNPDNSGGPVAINNLNLAELVLRRVTVDPVGTPEDLIRSNAHLDMMRTMYGPVVNELHKLHRDLRRGLEPEHPSIVHIEKIIEDLTA